MKTVNGASLYAPAVYGPAGRILCTVYTAEGNGPHPVLIFTHGYPGHEKNLDLAQSLRRTGFSSSIVVVGEVEVIFPLREVLKTQKPSWILY